MSVIIGSVGMYLLVLLSFHLHLTNARKRWVSFNEFMFEIRADLNGESGTFIPQLGIHLLVVCITFGFVSIINH